MTVRKWQWLGVAGSALVAVGGLRVGVGPSNDAVQLPPDAVAAILWPMAVAYLGMTLLVLAWWMIGRLRPEPAVLIRTGVMWAVPFALSGPIFSRDVYSYLAQGAMTTAGIDPYRWGPQVLSGELSANVPPIWQDTPAPYGPVFLRLAGAVTTLTGNELWPGLIGMRLLAVAGVAVLAVTVPRLARECGVDPSAALWLGVLNPLVLLHLVVDAHNDAVMVALMCAGLLLALRHRPVVGVVLITLAGLVKGPALLGLAFVGVLWAGRLPGRFRLLRAGGAVLLLCGGTAVAVTTVAGTGFGWVPALRAPTRARTWMSLTTHLGGLFGAQEAVWLAGLLLAGVLTLVLLHRVGTGSDMVAACGVALVAFVVLSPVVHVWYLLWGLVPLAAAGSDRIRRVAAYTSPVLVVLAPPNDAPTGAPMVLGGILGVAAGLLVYTVVRTARRRTALVLDAV
ncbi:polyprenol phosphomannose-dependent alpha 1,6 mannosyltransferase MptB [Actinoplanes sichuanensis]|uniref:Polyprenol phosphomannose-dependent alpha 1,6 mannosyltransferase MptB n=1 Tax=Actinoplanes sichuanensis TaxID=512349 RepID=A0ABW4AAU0_9ACTN|nr:polyprenol phosphomannose-dependent alpha 1,6 mannosyltransferase MptB [Actinoplanes sichuanensis]BEL06407.1 polyprenol phosphomannose-dependent alpha 1,6 mannosyltransferase MptB [Actinoplanes sichuanensis]